MAPTFWLYSHNFTHSGAPLVLAAIARELAAAGLRKQLRIVSWGGLHDQRYSTLQHQLIAEGIDCYVLSQGESPPQIRRGDRILLNTVALPDAVIRQALDWLFQRKLLRLDWYAHESDPELWIESHETQSLILRALNFGGLQMRVPSSRVLLTYQKWLRFSGNTLDVQCPVLEPSPVFKCSGSFESLDFHSLRLVLVGAAGCGNKGHLWLLRLLQSALNVYSNNEPGMRQIKLKFLGLETGKYAALSRVVVNHANNLLGDKFSWNESCSRDQILQEIAESNLLINCSYKESFSCVCIEAMALGLPLLRIRNGGFEEQLITGSTGFDLGLPTPEIAPEQIECINRLRDLKQTPCSVLEKMSKDAKFFSDHYAKLSYLNWLMD